MELGRGLGPVLRMQLSPWDSLDPGTLEPSFVGAGQVALGEGGGREVSGGTHCSALGLGS